MNNNDMKRSDNTRIKTNSTYKPILLTRMLIEFPYQKSPLPVIDTALKLAEISQNDLFADLGCGDGAVLIRAAQKFKIYCVGFEIDRNLAETAKRNIKAAGLSNLVDVILSDLFTADVSKFNVIYVYPSPKTIKGLTEKILKESTEGTRILIHDHPLLNVQPAKVVQIRGGEIHTHKVYLYEM